MADPIATQIADVLSANAELYSLCGLRILDMDYRTTGWNSSPVNVFDADGIILPTIVVDDVGGDKPLGSPKDAERVRIAVWAFSSRSNTGHTEVSRIMRVAKNVLTKDASPISRTSLRFLERVGVVIADDGLYDRITFHLVGIPSLA